MVAPMTPVEITSRFHRLSTRIPGRLATPHREVWSARSTDGVWLYERLEMPGTPWEITHVPTGVTMWFGSLPKARRATAGGVALREVELRLAEAARPHNRGSCPIFPAPCATCQPATVA